MKKLLIVSFLAMILVSLMGGVAFAGGWTIISYGVGHDPNNEFETDADTHTAIWNPEGADGIVPSLDDPGEEDGSGLNSPHGGFSASTSRCRVCHAVHMANAGSWRLLRDGTSEVWDSEPAGQTEERGMDRASECSYCHGVTGATKRRPWRPKKYTVKGEHTLGSDVIPDATAPYSSFSGNGMAVLSCGSCHTVHGAGSLYSLDNPNITPVVTAGKWAAKILRQDPNGDTKVLAATYAGRADAAAMLALAGSVTTESAQYATLSNFCGDCHNQNPSWDTNGNDDTQTALAENDNSYRSNGRSHVQGPAADGSLEVYGKSDKLVANWGDIEGNDYAGVDNSSTPQNTKRGCRGCHAAADNGNLSAQPWTVTNASDAADRSAWPHQTRGAKLLFDTYTEGTTQQAEGVNGWGERKNDGLRVLPRMDQLCAKCHREGGVLVSSPPAASEGVGLSF